MSYQRIWDFYNSVMLGSEFDKGLAKVVNLLREGNANGTVEYVGDLQTPEELGHDVSKLGRLLCILGENYFPLDYEFNIKMTPKPTIPLEEMIRRGWIKFTPESEYSEKDN